MIVLQLILYCALFIFLVKCAVKSSGLNCLYFYPKEYIDEVTPGMGPPLKTRHVDATRTLLT